MEKISIILFALGVIGYLINDDLIGHIWGVTFFNTSVLYTLSTLNLSGETNITEQEVFFVFVTTSLFLIAGIFILKYRFKNSNIDEMQK